MNGYSLVWSANIESSPGGQLLKISMKKKGTEGWD